MMPGIVPGDDIIVLCKSHSEADEGLRAIKNKSGECKLGLNGKNTTQKINK
jgi:hypothetical protein